MLVRIVIVESLECGSSWKRKGRKNPKSKFPEWPKGGTTFSPNSKGDSFSVPPQMWMWHSWAAHSRTRSIRRKSYLCAIAVINCLLLSEVSTGKPTPPKPGKMGYSSTGLFLSVNPTCTHVQVRLSPWTIRMARTRCCVTFAHCVHLLLRINNISRGSDKVLCHVKGLQKV